MQYLHELTELGNAHRFADLIDGEIKWVDKLEKWMYWDGSNWLEDNDGYVNRQYEKMVLQHLVYEISEFKEELEKTEQAGQRKILEQQMGFLYAWHKQSQGYRVITNSLTLLKALDGMTISLLDFDSDPLLVACSNGIVDLPSGRMVPGQKDIFVLKHVDCVYDKNAQCPQWKKFIYWAMCDDEDMVAFLKRVIGSGLVGSPKGKDKLSIFHGSQGGNGKSTLVDTIDAIYHDYSTVGSAHILTDDRASSHMYHVARLVGIRMLIINEFSETGRIANRVVKSLIDSGQVEARNPAGRPFAFQPVFTPILVTNPKPQIGTDSAVWRRIYLVPFDNHVSEDEQDKGLKEKLLRERAGIFKWCVEGAVDFLQKGYSPPDKVLAATSEYRAEEDTVKQFIDECCIPESNHVTPTGRARGIYSKWCEERGSKPLGEKRFTQELRRLGITVDRFGQYSASHIFDYKLKPELKYRFEQ